MNKTLRKPWTYVLFLLPLLVLYIMFFIYPMISAAITSFMKWNGLTEPKFNGLTNYKHAYHDAKFWDAVLNNGKFILFSVFVQVPIILFFSLLISNVKKLKGLYKTAVFVPSVMSTAVIGILWSFIYEPDIGLFNLALTKIGLQPVMWLSDSQWAMFSILITNAWQWTGFYIVMVLAAILSIPREIDEAAIVDGAGAFTRATRITVPLIMPVISVVIMLSIAGAMKAADIIIVMTKGGPGGVTDVMATYLIKYGITNAKYGYGNSIGVLIFVFSLMLTALYQVLVARRVERVEY
ncbi:carbohydrate ABC transporter permease [Paenibacillus sacheonensis]|uniref:ABC transporter permease subunit n=1 Tax=Paenibacillus sacheonensis TaxID=742054 RepID=A0A7X5BZQ0_9BACL|nr:sugar ABC transporter permease [Paenibacillus sacheonensis]MBM7564059.1 raffinose/stachyose/melibiose transport system permease protein [Paenibacillus sacheonensis]NBC67609.1 ABC transporter permease subunit [Paenibacillus sacheonensis]